MKITLQHLTYMLLAAMIILSPACNKDILNKKPLNDYSDEDVWKDPPLVNAYVNNLYLQMRHGFNEVMLSSVSDESRFIHNYGTQTSVTDALSPDDLGAFSSQFGEWEKYYRAIRNCNIFFEMIGQVPFTDEAQRQRLIGEVHYLRAYFYQILVKYWGGVPLVKKPFKLSDRDEMLIARGSFEECVNFIVEDCDKAAAILPPKHEQPGRATKYAAMSLKSRILLFAASPLFAKPGIPATESYRGYVNSTPAHQAERYQKALDAAKAIIDLNVFAIYKPTSNATDNYSRVFLDKDNSEIIFARYFNRQFQGTSHDLYNGPNGYHNWGGNVPLENFVSGYQMADGSEFSWANNTHAANPYANRDPRFYATILYNGAKWKKRPSDAIALDPIGEIQTGRFEKKNDQGTIIIQSGLDTRSSTIENWNGTYTGYYIRKFMDLTLDAQFFRGDQAWPWFRYSEILLNAAEAYIGLQQYDNARPLINQIRTRAGMPAIPNTVTGDALTEAYRYERRYELSFEEHRYFDARRWLIAENVFSGPANGIEILGKLNPDNTLKWTYKVVNSGQDRVFSEKHYLLPIMAAEIRRNDKMKQNPKYN
ncbi:RagB/SusD family nutrient uptake outer membrane protein [Chitinophaga deserti]|uniref:RagB/SusD family nutrient uptake outer membrane protein n=1 Tax=Chitinophaga deserti TaxID=2164099 RepID=UPI000D6DC17D|nr:RagB/SusD family nutrient uptake outer membrane protein [Chitinophaga deserti]